ncbi:MAG: hypothetical protein KatS3mg068_0153 [Candidatus Sericytochromatia bacterium]|nr:MAG: hypothetical protein KatS3mg068_0153 [Candidatus Sericytochromatia bacterium]
MKKIFLILILTLLKANYYLNNKAIEYYNNKDYKNAIKYFKESYIKNKNIIDLYNLANSYYKNEEYEKAIYFYKKFSNANKDITLKSKAYYNIGNSYYRNYQKNNKNTYIEKSLEYYYKSLDFDKNNIRAIENINFIKNLLNKRINNNKDFKKNNQRENNIDNKQIEKDINELKELEKYYFKYLNRINRNTTNNSNKKDW